MSDPLPLQKLINSLVRSVEQSREVRTPFYHLQFDHVFPDDVYAQMMGSMPVSSNYRALPGRDNVNLNEQGACMRVKVDLFSEYIRHFPPGKRELWDLVGSALCSIDVRDAFVRRLAPMLERR